METYLWHTLTPCVPHLSTQVSGANTGQILNSMAAMVKDLSLVMEGYPFIIHGRELQTP